MIIVWEALKDGFELAVSKRYVHRKNFSHPRMDRTSLCNRYAKHWDLSEAGTLKIWMKVILKSSTSSE